MQPIYLPSNTAPAYQLNWSLSLFGKQPLPSIESWLESVMAATESDGVRILNANSQFDNVIQFFLSTRPEMSPSKIVASVKSRLQYQVRLKIPKAFRRNYHIQSLGDANSKVLDEYVVNQPLKHRMADRDVQARIESLQYYDQSINLSEPRIGTYGRFVHSLHVVIENREGWHEVNDSQLRRVRNIIIAAAQKKRWKISRIGLLSNHAHILLGVDVTETPESVSLSIMNNIAYVYQMQPILKFGYYAGTFGAYDRGVMQKV